MEDTVCPVCRSLQVVDLICERHQTKPQQQSSVRSRPGLFRRTFRFLRWFSLGWSLLTLALIVTPSRPPVIAASPDTSQSVDARLQELGLSSQPGQARALEIDEAELNTWIRSKLTPQNPNDVRGEGALPAIAGRKSAEDRSPLRDVRVELLKDSFLAYVAFSCHGKGLSFQIEGRINVKDGCIRLVPTGGKIGSFPLPQGVLEAAAYWFFDAPANRENFRLPSGIHDVRVQNGNLVIISD